MKNGEITSTQLVTIIITLAGAIVIMLFLPTLLNEREVQREICYDSVALRAALPDSFGAKNLPSLKCTTRKVCLTDKAFGKGDCVDDFGEKEKYETVRVSSNSRELEVNRFIARELASCWSMMGKGEWQIFTREASEKKSCVVCTRIAFDAELKNNLKGEVKGLGDYILTHEVPTTNVSYWKYLTNNDGGVAPLNDKISTEQKAIVFMEIGKSDLWETLFQGIEMVGWGTIGAFVGGPKGGVAGVIFGYYDGAKVGKFFTGKEFGSLQILSDYKSEELEKLECTSFENIP
jgi:hypothetical protein